MEIHKVWHRSRHVFTFFMSCFGELVRCLGGFQKLGKIAGEGIVGTILQIIVKLVGQGPVCMVFT